MLSQVACTVQLPPEYRRLFFKRCSLMSCCLNLVLRHNGIESNGVSHGWVTACGARLSDDSAQVSRAPVQISVASRRGARACGGCCAARWIMGTQQDGPSHDEYWRRTCQTVSRDFIYLMSMEKWTFPLIHVFIKIDFSYGYLHADSEKHRSKALSSILFFITLEYVSVFMFQSGALVCSLCCVRYLYLSLVFIVGRHEDLICVSVISGLFLWRSQKFVLNY